MESRTKHAVDYALSEVGMSLHVQLELLIDWALEHEGYIRRSRERFDGANEAGSG